MKTQSINRNEWESFMDEFSRRHDGWLASIQVSDGAGGRRPVTEDLPFRGISAEVGVGGRDYMNIRVGRSDTDSIIHRIAAPQNVYLIQTDNGLHEGIEIESTDEGRTLVRFTAPRQA